MPFTISGFYVHSVWQHCSYAETSENASCDSSESVSLDSDSESDVDLEELYKSFKTVSEVEGVHRRAQEEHEELYSGSQLTVFQCYTLTL